MKTRAKSPKKKDKSRERTNVPGQNPKADDSPDKDEHHDENRINPYEPKVARR